MVLDLVVQFTSLLGPRNSLFFTECNDSQWILSWAIYTVSKIHFNLISTDALSPKWSLPQVFSILYEFIIFLCVPHVPPTSAIKSLNNKGYHQTLRCNGCHFLHGRFSVRIQVSLGIYMEIASLKATLPLPSNSLFINIVIIPLYIKCSVIK
jgi:hypothetical protein